MDNLRPEGACECLERIVGSWADLPLGTIALYHPKGWAARRACGQCYGTGKAVPHYILPINKDLTAWLIRCWGNVDAALAKLPFCATDAVLRDAALARRRFCRQNDQAPWQEVVEGDGWKLFGVPIMVVDSPATSRTCSTVDPDHQRTPAREDDVRKVLDTFTREQLAFLYVLLQDNCGMTRERADRLLREARWK